MPVYIGVDFHARSQTVCWSDTADGEIHSRVLDHQCDDVRAFYSQFTAPAVVGVEATSYARWFHRLVEETGHRLLVGDAYAIRKCARRRQKNDQRDAGLILDLLLHDEFPAVHVPAPGSQEVLRLLRYRHRLVQIRTKLRNGLQSLALNYRLQLGARLWTEEGRKQLQALRLEKADATQREFSLELHDAVSAKIRSLEAALAAQAASEVGIVRLRTHPGVGLLTALALLHTLEPVTRFARASQVAAYCGLDPREDSSGENVRFGHISKQGNRLLRYLLVEAAHAAVRRGGDEQLRSFYFRLIEKRKNPAVATVAVARKLALRLYVLPREEIDYTELRRRDRDARRARQNSSLSMLRDD
jgi:transposase